MRRKPRLVWLSLSAVSALCGPAQAQAPNQSAPESGSTVLETVTVTAQKREEKLQEVPIAITAMNKAQLQARGIDNVADLSALAPGLQVSRSPSNDSISQIAIRGNSEINPAIYWDPAVGIYIDGVYLGKSQGTVFDVVDLQRVEVLRGPQGTLYGRNTIGGAINLVTRPPTGEWGGEVSTDVGNYGAWVRKASVDLPAFGIAKLSFAARSEQRDGWVETQAGSSVSEMNDRHSNGFRFAADIDFSKDFQAALRYDRSAINQNGTFSQLYRLRPTGAFSPLAPGGSLLFGLLSPFASTERQETAAVNGPQYQKVIVKGGSATLSYKLGTNDTLKSISAYRQLVNNDGGDYDGSPLAIAQTERLTNFDQASQELQWVGRRGALNYVGGLYYYRDDGDTNNPQSYFSGNANYDSRYGTRTNARAVYGQLDYQVLDPLSLSAGLRYTSEKKGLTRTFGVAGAAPAPFFYFIPEGTAAEKTFDAFTPTVSASWKFNEQLSTYIRYAEGFKSGGFNGEFSDTTLSPAQNVAETQTPFKPEKLKSLELGAKSSFAGGRAQLNGAIFHNKLDDYQVSVFTASGAAASVIRNAGKATIEGLELEAVVQPIKALRLQANYAWLHGKYDEFIDLDPNLGVETNQADNRALVHAPQSTFNLVADAQLARLSFGELRALVDYAYTSAYYTYPYQIAATNTAAPVAGDTKVSAHGLLNARLALGKLKLGKTASGELALWVRNALDEDEPVNFIDFGPGFGSLTPSYFLDPRTFGATATLRW
ncbi:TonB-dependent receptor [Stagnimonas aquatica]|uniref:TonB-dependent receptor n=1 Tax=Stagnimonas aquatica TaxID=2689987 RepID=A0A3N0V1K2_9GAMM|nr:TonB-dependent receptor [Stagnimonas aquatica]ROH86434.1 TonB-dependent receptor [Stagnimonas aquatica]